MYPIYHGIYIYVLDSVLYALPNGHMEVLPVFNLLWNEHNVYRLMVYRFRKLNKFSLWEFHNIDCYTQLECSLQKSVGKQKTKERTDPYGLWNVW